MVRQMVRINVPWRVSPSPAPHRLSSCLLPVLRLLHVNLAAPHPTLPVSKIADTPTSPHVVFICGEHQWWASWAKDGFARRVPQITALGELAAAVRGTG